jgi:hypothetical protein
LAQKNGPFYGDNLDVLQGHIKEESVDLIDLDPPFNNVSFVQRALRRAWRNGVAGAASLTSGGPFVMRITILLASALAMLACGGATGPVGPSSSAGSFTPATTTYTVSGRIVTVNNGGLPVTGASIAAAGMSTTTDASGRYALTLPWSTSTTLVTITGAGFLQRKGYFSGSILRTVDWDVIQEAGGFDLKFYRQFVRNGLDSTALQPIRRWMRGPSVYLRTVDDAGVAVDSATLDATERALTESVPMWTAQRYSAAVVRGTESRGGMSGWITVGWKTDRPTDRCGQTAVAGDIASIEFFPYANCRCGGVGPAIYQKLVRHELGHALGFFHTDSANDVMYGQTSAGCDSLPSARERYHAAIVYGSGDRPGRPVGNVDVDADAASSVHLAPMVIR